MQGAKAHPLGLPRALCLWCAGAPRPRKLPSARSPCQAGARHARWPVDPIPAGLRCTAAALQVIWAMPWCRVQSWRAEACRASCGCVPFDAHSRRRACSRRTRLDPRPRWSAASRRVGLVGRRPRCPACRGAVGRRVGLAIRRQRACACHRRISIALRVLAAGRRARPRDRRRSLNLSIAARLGFLAASAEPMLASLQERHVLHMPSAVAGVKEQGTSKLPA